MGRSQPGVGLWSPHFFVLHFFESGLTLNPHNKRHSFGLFISLYLCCVVDCINKYIRKHALPGNEFGLIKVAIKFIVSISCNHNLK